MNIAFSEHILKWEFWFTLALIVHILAASLALLTFWIPLATAKGKYYHITSGIVFLASIAVAIVCAVIMTVMKVFDPIGPIPSKGETLFFLYLCLFTISAAWHGIRVFNLRRSSDVQAINFEKYHAFFVGAAGIATSVVGIIEGNALYALFPFIGIGLAYNQFRFWQGWPYDDFKILMKEHMLSMITCVIATLTAFCVIAVPRSFGIGSDSLVLWFGPTVVFLPIIYYWNRKLA